jgi:glutaryl-CoA dehydrogenase
MSRLDPLDLYDVRSLLSDEEQLVRDSVARLVNEQALPIVRECFEEQRFPRELIPELANLGLLGSSLQGYGCAGLNAVSCGLICQELERADSGLRSFVSVGLKDAGRMTPVHVSLAKRNNCRMALDIARDCRDLLGAAGISTEHDPIRHALNLESVITCEGTETIHQLTLGRELTGLSAF